MRNMGPAVVKTRSEFADSLEQHSQGFGLAAMIDRYPGRAFALLTGLYFVVFFALSSVKLLWLDELITLHLAQLSGPQAIWHALAAGADPNPLITYILVHWSRQLLGPHEFAYRLPASIGYWIGLASLFFYLVNRFRGSWAIFGCLVSMAMAAFDYSFESRSYGIMYGFAMLAFLCWTITAEAGNSPTVRWASLCGMTLALAAGISTNYFAVLAFLPPAAGELVRTIVRARRRRSGAAMEFSRHKTPVRFPLLRALSFRVWIAFAIAASPLLLYRPLIARSIAQFAPYAWNKVSLDQLCNSYTEMVEIILYPILALFVIGLLVLLIKPRVLSVCGNCRSRLLPPWADSIFAPYRKRLPIPVHEAAGVLVFLCYPICGYLIASIQGGMLSPRFVIPVCFGFAIAATIVAEYLFQNLRHSATVLLCFVCAWFLCREAVVAYSYQEQKQAFYNVVGGLKQAEGSMPADSPIVVSDPLLALTFWHYAPDYLAAREIFPLDFPAIRYFRHDDSPEENLWAGRSILYRMPVVPLATFQHSAGPYLIVASPGNWLLQDLLKHRYTFVRLPIKTQARSIGGFTPLAHGAPAIYKTQGDRNLVGKEPAWKPVPFKVSENLPMVKWYAPPELLNDE
jgi:hypothetical protein